MPLILRTIWRVTYNYLFDYQPENHASQSRKVLITPYLLRVEPWGLKNLFEVQNKIDLSVQFLILCTGRKILRVGSFQLDTLPCIIFVIVKTKNWKTDENAEPYEYAYKIPKKKYLMVSTVFKQYFSQLGIFVEDVTILIEYQIVKRNILRMKGYNADKMILKSCFLELIYTRFFFSTEVFSITPGK